MKRSECTNTLELESRQKRQRTGSQSESSVEEQKTFMRQELKTILDRYHYYAAGNKASPASEKSVAELNHMVGHEHLVQNCPLCLENIAPGESYTVLPCGHIFHKGYVGQYLDEDTPCKGILFWLKKQCACPSCRFELERAIKLPSKEEKILVPILKRQSSVIKAQKRLIAHQKTQLKILRCLSAQNLFNKRIENTVPNNENNGVCEKENEDDKSLRRKILFDVVQTLGEKIPMSVENLDKVCSAVKRIELKFHGKSQRDTSANKDTLKQIICDDVSMMSFDRKGK